MLYTFSQANYSETELERYLTHMATQDVVVLWQDGVFLALKYPALFLQCKANCYALDLDVNARNLMALMPSKVRSISMTFLVDITAQYFPQIAL